MKTALGMLAVLATGSLLSGCSTESPGEGGPTAAAGGSSTSGGGGAAQVPVSTTFEPTAEQTLTYMRYLGPPLLGRVLTDTEEAQITKDKYAAVKPLLDTWVVTPAFADAMRIMMELKLYTSGKIGQADYGLPGYLVRHVVANQQPWSNILTSTVYYDAADQVIPNDTNAPYSAGVLTTRGFMAGNAGRFNLGRAHVMLKTFMCRDYPHETELQPPIEKDRLRVMFRAKDETEQMEAQAAGGFGNGLACFSCHGQFSNHAQPYVKFNAGGLYIADATGLQSETGQLGQSDRSLFTSHLIDPAEAGTEKAQYFGTEVENIAGGAAAMAKHDKFRECTLQHLLDFGVGLNPAFDVGIKGLKVAPEFLAEVASAVTATMPDPTIQALATAVYSDRRVMATTLNSLKR